MTPLPIEKQYGDVRPKVLLVLQDPHVPNVPPTCSRLEMLDALEEATVSQSSDMDPVPVDLVLMGASFPAIEVTLEIAVQD